jgi:UDP-3-O-[3-hydroxymyristoyl] glucosamine N-acyltransferase
MQHPGFFERTGPYPLSVIAERLGLALAGGADGRREIADVKPLSDAGAAHLSFADGKKFAGDLATTGAGACLVPDALMDVVPAHTAGVATRAPYRTFVKAIEMFYPEFRLPKGACVARGGRGGDWVHPTAIIDDAVTIEPGAVIGPEARIGAGTIISASAMIGFRCVIGRDSYVGPGASVMHAIIGDRVVIHAGTRIGQDGFGYAMGPQGHMKIPQIGRVIIGNDVEIGANTAVDRGALKDTIIGEGTKIDNLVQIAHNVSIGKHCVIAGMTGIAGSAVLGDFVVMGAQCGCRDHVNIGSGARFAARAGVLEDVPPKAVMSGWPARPFRTWAREVATVKRLSARGKVTD